MPLIGGRGGRPGLIGTAARTAVIAGTAQTVSGRVARRQQERYAQEAAEQAPPPPEAAAAPPPPADPLAAQLQQLAALRDQGILTEEEFAAKKAQVLGI